MRQLIRKLFASLPIVDGVFRRIIWSRIHFPEAELRLLDRLVGRPFDIAIDVGAALGSYAWVLNRKSKSVVAFEPGELHYRNLRAGSLWSRVQCEQAAVGEGYGVAELYTPGNDNDARHQATLSLMNPVINSRETHRSKVDVVSIDSYSAQNFETGRSIDIIKIDVEGFENAVLNGAMTVLKRDFPIVIAEIEARHNPNYKEVFDLLEDLEYCCFALEKDTYRKFSSHELSTQPVVETIRNTKSERTQGYINNFVFQHRNSHVQVIRE